MNSAHHRREFLASGAPIALGLCGAAVAGRAAAAVQPVPQSAAAPPASAWPGFPHQDPALVKEIVGASHARLDRVKELLAAHPALAKASYDWGFGDWESALGAAAHVGNREIAALLLANGARLDIFAATMLGMTDAVKAMLAAQPELDGVRGPHGITLFAHATAGKCEEMIAYLRGVPGAGEEPPTPLTDDEMKVYLGEYARPDGAGTIAVGKNRFGMTIKPDRVNDNRLVRTGEHTFHPVGAPNLRVAFTVADGRAVRIEIVEDTWFVAATRP